MEFPKIHCADIPYRSGFIEVLPNIHDGHVNLEIWHLHPDHDRAATDITDERISDVDVQANIEVELSVDQARELVRLLSLAIDAAIVRE